ncbi:hypothetical protein O3P69_011764 [Scylla paramamosain]|uniref:Uncharacterized protein n=1 Tax=Scylla paramamosain TaxID=85552 RepID=A0AAW0SHH2_SCYPA
MSHAAPTRHALPLLSPTPLPAINVLAESRPVQQQQQPRDPLKNKRRITLLLIPIHPVVFIPPARPPLTASRWPAFVPTKSRASHATGRPGSTPPTREKQRAKRRPGTLTPRHPTKIERFSSLAPITAWGTSNLPLDLRRLHAFPPSVILAELRPGDARPAADHTPARCPDHTDKTNHPLVGAPVSLRAAHLILLITFSCVDKTAPQPQVQPREKRCSPRKLCHTPIRPRHATVLTDSGPLILPPGHGAVSFSQGARGSPDLIPEADVPRSGTRENKEMRRRKDEKTRRREDEETRRWRDEKTRRRGDEKMRRHR